MRKEKKFNHIIYLYWQDAIEHIMEIWARHTIWKCYDPKTIDIHSHVS